MRENVIRWIMLVSGALTCSMLYAAIAPEAALRATFGDTLTGPVAEIVVRNWGFLIAILGAMLIYGAWHRPVRAMVLLAAATGKIVFVMTLLIYGRRTFGHGAGFAVWVDSIMVVLYVSCLVMTPEKIATAAHR